MSILPGNPFSDLIDRQGALPHVITDAQVLAAATLALAHETHRAALAQERQAVALEARVRIAALTYQHRGHHLPDDLTHLIEGATS